MRSLVLALLVAGCTTPEEVKPPVPGDFVAKGEVLLTVDGKPIYEDQVKLALEHLSPEQKEQMLASGQLRTMIEKMALGDLFYQKAIEAKLYEDPEVMLKLAMAQRDALAQAYVEQQLESQLGDDALKKAYDERQVQFAAPEAHVRLILLTDEKLAKDVWDRLQKGEDFAALAKKHSLDKTSGSQGGDMGWVTKGQFTEALDAAIFADGATGPKGPISANGGWVLADVVERRGNKPFEDVKSQLKEVVRQEASEKLIGDAEKAAKFEWKKDPEPLLSAAPAAPAAPAEGAAPAAPVEGAAPAEAAAAPATTAEAPAAAPAPAH